MKAYLFLILTVFFSCDQNTKKNPLEKIGVEKPKNSLKTEQEDDFNIQPWFQYYKKENPNFKHELFQLKQTSPISYDETTVAILNQKGFNEIYKPFLVFNKNKTKYLDFDSYQWFLQTDGSVSFEADQQVILVDFQKKSAHQIAFFGPSFWAEDAYWKGDSVAVILGNTHEKIPFITSYNFEKNTMKYYQYRDTLVFETPYSTIRLQNNGIKIE